MTPPFIVLFGHNKEDLWVTRCTCKWSGELHATRQSAQDEAMIHAIETGHHPGWLDWDWSK